MLTNPFNNGFVGFINSWVLRAPENGEIVLKIEKQPVSVNSKSASKKDVFKTFIKEIISETEYYLSGDVKIEIEWYVSEQIRYESVSALDVDNIIKPLLDAISGVDGILIDDNQVQFISCSWLDLNLNDSEHLIIRIKFIPDKHIEKNGIYFIEYDKGFCFPIWDNEPIGISKLRVETNEKLVKYRYELEGKGFPYSKVRYMMPMQRVFHRSRLNNFRIVKLEEIKKTLSIT